MCWLDLFYEYVGGYVVSLVLFTKFNHMSKKKKTISHQISDQSYAHKKFCISTNQCPKQRKKKSRQKMPKPNQSANWDFRFNRRSPSQKK